MDPILEQMRRVKSVADIREAKFRDWTDYLVARFAALEAALADAQAKQPRKGAAA